MANRSLQRELLGWLVVPLTAVVSFNVWTTYKNAAETANLITDRTLLASARVIAENIRENDGVLEAPIPPAALEMFASDQPDRVVYRVTTPRGQVIAGYPDVIAPPGLPVDLKPVYFETTFRDQPVHAVAIAQPIVSKQNPGNAMVAVGQTLRAHDKLMTSLWLKALRDQVLLVAAAGLLGVFGLRRGLAYSLEECARLDAGCRGLLLSLERGGILSPTQREIVIERLLALDSEELSLEQVKWVVLMVLSCQPGEEAACERMEDMLHELPVQVPH